MNDILILMLGGTLAGIANFFLNYIEIPFQLSKLQMPGHIITYKPPLTCKLALVGYVFIGICGSLLTFLLFELEVIKKVGDLRVLLGYGIVFGFSAVKLLQRSLTIVIPTPKTDTSKINE